MRKKSLAQALKLCNINNLDDLVRAVPKEVGNNRAHLARVYRGERPVSPKLAEVLKARSGGVLTLDYLLSFRGDGEKKRNAG